MPTAPFRISTLRERPLHAALKHWYSEPGDGVEVAVDGYIIDIVRADRLIEIQTRGFAGMRPKLRTLLDRGHTIRIVHPIAVDRWIVRVDADGAVLSRRRSPRHEGPADLASELVSFPGLLAHPRLEVEVLLVSVDELRVHVPGRCWRRGGWTVLEHRLVDVLDRLVVASPGDLARLLPDGLPERFTTADVAVTLGSSRRLAQQLVYCLRVTGCVEVTGRRAAGVEYRLAPSGAA